MGILHKVLILGTGPAAVQIVVNLKISIQCIVGIAGRMSMRSEQFFHELYKNKNKICVHVQNKKHKLMAGECCIDYAFAGYKTVAGEWDTIIVSVTNDAYISVLKQLDDSVMKYVRHVILVTPAIGSNTLVFSYLKQAGYAAEVISLSTYYAATKGYESSVNVLTKGVKKKIYIGSVWENSELCRKISSLLQQLGIEVELVKNPYEAESRNISIYVHPPIFMNEYALDIIFRGNNSIKYAYKFYPEGPLTQYVIHDIVEQWKEISFLLTYCKVERFNLLMFLNDDNYPVRLQSLSRDDIENFLFFDAIKQEYLIYIRYTALLIDPFSEPDEKGRYFDFSAVPIQKIYQDQEGYWHVPRIPKEEYYRLKLLQGIARWASVRTHTIDKFIKNYEQKLHWFKQVHKELMISHDFIPQDFGDDLRVICNALKIKGSLEHHE